MNNKSKDSALPDDLLALFQGARKLTQANLDKLAKATEELDQDPSFRAEYLKGLFVEHIQEAMEQKGISQSELARRWGKSRQYLSRVLSEDRRVNFTIETMVELAGLVGRKIEVHMLNPDENTHVLRCKVTPRRVSPLDRFKDPQSSPAPNVCHPEFQATTRFKGRIDDATRLSA